MKTLVTIIIEQLTKAFLNWYSKDFIDYLQLLLKYDLFFLEALSQN